MSGPREKTTARKKIRPPKLPPPPPGNPPLETLLPPAPLPSVLNHAPPKLPPPPPGKPPIETLLPPELPSPPPPPELPPPPPGKPPIETSLPPAPLPSVLNHTRGRFDDSNCQPAFLPPPPCGPPQASLWHPPIPQNSGPVLNTTELMLNSNALLASSQESMPPPFLPPPVALQEKLPLSPINRGGLLATSEVSNIREWETLGKDEISGQNLLERSGPQSAAMTGDGDVGRQGSAGIERRDERVQQRERQEWTTATAAVQQSVPRSNAALDGVTRGPIMMGKDQLPKALEGLGLKEARRREAPLPPEQSPGGRERQEWSAGASGSRRRDEEDTAKDRPAKSGDKGTWKDRGAGDLGSKPRGNGREKLGEGRELDKGHGDLHDQRPLFTPRGSGDSRFEQDRRGRSPDSRKDDSLNRLHDKRPVSASRFRESGSGGSSPRFEQSRGSKNREGRAGLSGDSRGRFPESDRDKGSVGDFRDQRPRELKVQKEDHGWLDQIVSTKGQERGYGAASDRRSPNWGNPRSSKSTLGERPSFKELARKAGASEPGRDSGMQNRTLQKNREGEALKQMHKSHGRQQEELYEGAEDLNGEERERRKRLVKVGSKGREHIQSDDERQVGTEPSPRNEEYAEKRGHVGSERELGSGQEGHCEKEGELRKRLAKVSDDVREVGIEHRARKGEHVEKKGEGSKQERGDGKDGHFEKGQLQKQLAKVASKEPKRLVKASSREPERLAGKESEEDQGRCREELKEIDPSEGMKDTRILKERQASEHNGDLIWQEHEKKSDGFAGPSAKAQHNRPQVISDGDGRGTPRNESEKRQLLAGKMAAGIKRSGDHPSELKCKKRKKDMEVHVAITPPSSEETRSESGGGENLENEGVDKATSSRNQRSDGDSLGIPIDEVGLKPLKKKQKLFSVNELAGASHNAKRLERVGPKKVHVKKVTGGLKREGEPPRKKEGGLARPSSEVPEKQKGTKKEGAAQALKKKGVRKKALSLEEDVLPLEDGKETEADEPLVVEAAILAEKIKNELKEGVISLGQENVDEYEGPCCKAHGSGKECRRAALHARHTYTRMYAKAEKDEIRRFARDTKAGKTSSKRPDLKAGALMLKHGLCAHTEAYIGHVPGVKEGDIFKSRQELIVVGLHHYNMAGIDVLKENDQGNKFGMPLVVCVVDSNMYEGNRDLGDEIRYSGQGGGNMGTGKQEGDQGMVTANIALINSQEQGIPVRYISKQKGKNPTFKYHGLFMVDRYEHVVDNSKRVFYFYLRPMQAEQEKWKVLIADLSHGQERYPVRVVVQRDDEGTEPIPSFEYITKVIPGHHSSTFKAAEGCGCEGRCEPKTCSCAKLNEGGHFAYSSEGRILDRSRIIYECGPNCGCSKKKCLNRVTQKGAKVRLEVFKTEGKGLGVRTLDPIPEGTFVSEYTGVMITNNEANNADDTYLFDLELSEVPKDSESPESMGNPSSSREDNNELGGFATPPRCPSASASDRPFARPFSSPIGSGGGKSTMYKSYKSEEEYPFVLDARMKGSVARMVNHSCDPNLYVQAVLHDHHDTRAAHINLFAGKHIKALEELSYDYDYHVESGQEPRKACLCGSEKCRKWLM